MNAAVQPTLAGAVAPAPMATPFGARIVVGLLGVLLAVLVAGFNENVTKVALADIRGAMGIGHDEGTWLLALYAAPSVCAMAFAPWFAVTLSLRRFTLCAIAAFMLLGLLSPFVPNERCLMLLRALQGLAGGALPPMLMTVALRFLPANIKLYGLASYALTATFGPSLGTPLAAFWVEYVGWQWAFWQIIPTGLLAMAAVAWGLPQDPLRLERFAQFDWQGLLLGFPAISMLVIGLLQGERLAWFESPLIVALLGGGSLLLVLFLLNEWRHPLPFFKLQLLQLRNLSFALFTLGGVLFVLLASSLIPSSYLAQVQGYRPLQTAPVLLTVALPQLLALPLVAALCNLRRVDCRWVLATGLALLATSCVLGSQITSAWIRDDFYLVQALQIFAQPMAVLPLLMLSTGSIVPAQGPFASAWFNSVKGFAAVLATGLLDALTTARLHFHSSMLVDRLGNTPLLTDSANLATRLHKQAVVLTSADLYLCVAAIAVALILIIPFVPTRIYPPRAA
ncbi:EmrB/QacA family drug resistance transporter [Pseudomonas alcaligenes]|uniref:EmrB/QacA family drug resistance transporter n=1 Tax=Aquipseudomonas alcaligenes TaxID=43263 RepID=A0ABR7S1X3_AQUAC|nr:MFS transporter [Pseudomonas alcaligenes]MBC9251585.1 EmrB/QacA family drug resistance transporter [Pseudomonas alcaligenes]